MAPQKGQFSDFPDQPGQSLADFPDQPKKYEDEPSKIGGAISGLMKWNEEHGWDPTPAASKLAETYKRTVNPTVGSALLDLMPGSGLLRNITRIPETRTIPNLISDWIPGLNALRNLGETNPAERYLREGMDPRDVTAGAIKGVGAVAKGFTNPLGAAALASGGAGRVLEAGYPAAANALTWITRGASVPFAASGAHEIGSTLTNEQPWDLEKFKQLGQGGLELGMGLAGATEPFHTGRTPLLGSHDVPLPQPRLPGMEHVDFEPRPSPFNVPHPPEPPPDLGPMQGNLPFEKTVPSPFEYEGTMRGEPFKPQGPPPTFEQSMRGTDMSQFRNVPPEPPPVQSSASLGDIIDMPTDPHELQMRKNEGYVTDPSRRGPNGQLQMVKGGATQPTATPKTQVELPHELKGAKPRYKNYELEFHNDLEKALYIIAKETPSKRDADYLAFVMQHLQLDEAGARELGRDVRKEVGAQVKGQPEGVVQLDQMYDFAVPGEESTKLPESWQALHEDAPVPVAPADVTPSLIARMKAAGRELVGKDAQGNSLFQRLKGGSAGTFDPSEMFRNVGRLVRGEPMGAPAEVRQQSQLENISNAPREEPIDLTPPVMHSPESMITPETPSHIANIRAITDHEELSRIFNEAHQNFQAAHQADNLDQMRPASEIMREIVNRRRELRGEPFQYEREATGTPISSPRPVSQPIEAPPEPTVTSGLVAPEPSPEIAAVAEQINAARSQSELYDITSQLHDMWMEVHNRWGTSRNPADLTLRNQIDDLSRMASDRRDNAGLPYSIEHSIGTAPITSGAEVQPPIRGRVQPAVSATPGQADYGYRSYRTTQPTLPEQGPLQAEPMLPFEEDLAPRAIMEDLPTEEPSGRIPQKKLPFKINLPREQFERFQSQVQPREYENRQITSSSQESWGGFGESVVRSMKEGPPGLRVEKDWGNRKKIVFRDKDGQPLAGARLVTADDGGLGISALGKKQGAKYIENGKVKYRPSPKSDIAVVAVLEKAIQMNAAVPVGSFSEYTANLLKQMGRLVTDETGAVPLADIVDMFKRVGVKAKDIATRLFKEESGERQVGGVVDRLNELKSRRLSLAGEGGEGKIGGGDKGISLGREAYNFPRGVTTTADLSAPLRQGLPLILNKEWWTSWRQMVKSFGSEGAYQKTLNDLKSRKMFQREVDVKTGKERPSYAERAGIKLMDLSVDRLNTAEENIASNWVETGGFLGSDILGKETGLQRAYQKSAGRFARASNRAYTSYLNQLRADSFESLIKDAYKQFEAGGPGVTNPYTDLKFAKEIGDFVNTATGRGPMRTQLPYTRIEATEGGGRTLKTGIKEYSLEQHARLATNLLFSPRLIASRVRMLNPMTYSMASPFVRRQYLKALLGVGTAWGTVATLGKLAGADVSTDTDSADFGKIRIGNTRLDPAAGFQQYVVAASRLYNGTYTSSATQQSHEAGAGFQGETQKDIGERFLANKLHPVIKFAYDLLDASEYQPFQVGDRTAQMFVPLIVGDVVDLAKQDPSLLPWMAPLVASGMGTQTYGKGEATSKFIPPESDLTITKGFGINKMMPWNWIQ